MRSVVSSANVGSVIRLGAVPFIVVVLPDKIGRAERIEHSLAWLVLDPRAVGGCGSPPRTPE
jgi:hypothetical protein